MYKKLLEKFEKSKGQLVICKYTMSVLRLIGIGKFKDTNEYYYIFFDGNKISTADVYYGFIPLKKTISEVEYASLIEEHKKEAFDILEGDNTENEIRSVSYRRKDLLKFKNSNAKVIEKYWQLIY